MVQPQKLLRVLIITLALLFVPLVAMQFTHDVNWTASDFLVAGALLLGTGLIYEITAMRLTKPWQRMAVGAALLIILGVIWAQLAVGIF